MVRQSSSVRASSEEPISIRISPEALDAMRDVVRAELDRARAGVCADVKQLRGGGVLLGVAVALFIVALSMFDVAVVLAIGGTANSALIIAFIVVAEVLVIGYLGYRRLPRVLFERSRQR
jgi:Putative Actinobacterial Holin-X, holin superfamily III